MRRVVAAALVVAAGMVIVAPPPAALACTIAGPEPTEAEYLAMADVVFEGTAGSHRDPNTGASIISSGDPIFWTFTVDRVVKGGAGAVQEVASARFPGSCGITFEEGTRYRVYAKYADGGLHTRLGSGTRPAPAAVTTTTVLRPAQPAPPMPSRRIFLTG